MATTVTSTKENPTAKAKKGSRFAGDGRPLNGHGGGGDRHDDGASQDWSADRYRIGMMVGLGSVLMMFTALTSAYIVRAGVSNDWRPIAMPPLVLASTGLILLSSVVIEMARRSLRQGEASKSRNLLFLTLLLGLGFVATQLLTWQQLVAQGIYVSSNPHSSFFYVLTGMHGLHLLGGILALNYLLLRSWNRTPSDPLAEGKRQTLTDVVTLYWHFMDGLWIFLFLLLFLWR